MNFVHHCPVWSNISNVLQDVILQLLMFLFVCPFFILE
jgi:hypothetical protein